MAEPDRARLAAVLAADAELELRLRPAAALDRDPHQVADTVDELRDTSAAIFAGWLDGGTAYFVSRGLARDTARDVTVALVSALEGAFVLARTLRDAEPLLAVGRVLAPRYRGVALTSCASVTMGA